MKKVLSILLCTVLLISSVSVFAEENSKNVEVLMDLGIIEGYEDGSFKGDDIVTRAEAVVMVTRMLNLSVKYGNDTQFTDVDKDDWFAGFVNAAVEKGFVNGQGDGTFDPYARLSVHHIVKMLVCALGYDGIAEINHGGWAQEGYMVVARMLNLIDDSVKAEQTATRWFVAELLYKALETDLCANYYTGDVLWGKTVRSEFLKMEKIEGVVDSIYPSVAIDKTSGKLINLVVSKNYSSESDVKYRAKTSVAFLVHDEDVLNLKGKKVVCYAGENEKGLDTVYAIIE